MSRLNSAHQSLSQDQLNSYQTNSVTPSTDYTTVDVSGDTSQPSKSRAMSQSSQRDDDGYFVPSKISARRESRKTERTPSMLMSLQRARSVRMSPERQQSDYNTQTNGSRTPIRRLPSFMTLDAHTDFIVIKHKLSYHYLLAMLLLFSPLGILASVMQMDATLVFVCNFLAIVPLAWLLEETTEQLALHCSQLVAGLINVTLGNAEELIISIVALRRGLLDLVQTSLLGSILSNLLLVLGASFLAGGLYRSVTRYNKRGAQLAMSMLMFAAMSFVLPCTFTHAFANVDEQSLLMVSRLIACQVFCVYLFYLLFQLKTHKHWFVDQNADASDSSDDEGDMTANAAATGQQQQDGVEEADLSGLGSLLLLAGVTILVCVQSDLLVDSIEGVTKRWHIPQAFIGLIMLPIVGNAAEHATAVGVAIKDKMSLSIGIAIGSSAQIALCLLPGVTLVAWVMDQPLTLNFGSFESVCMILAVLMVTSLLKDGESSWIQGL